MPSKQDNSPQSPERSKSPKNPKKPYRSPELVACGDVRDVTMGGSPGVGDSGNGALEKPFGT